MGWDAGHYLKFEDERTRPIYDLVGAIGLDGPKRIVDLGCGPGNSTQVLKERWPGARVIGVDS
ncbi:MAG: SAM-dependent methyltransferase [Verrucomicrobiota bacterium]